MRARPSNRIPPAYLRICATPFARCHFQFVAGKSVRPFVSRREPPRSRASSFVVIVHHFSVARPEAAVSDTEIRLLLRSHAFSDRVLRPSFVVVPSPRRARASCARASKRFHADFVESEPATVSVSCARESCNVVVCVCHRLPVALHSRRYSFRAHLRPPSLFTRTRCLKSLGPVFNTSECRNLVRSPFGLL